MSDKEFAEAIVISDKAFAEAIVISDSSVTLPALKAFRDAIASLSPEQRRFAKAYRSMQLEGSLFGVLVIELKPALEALLGLADGALTKEIALTRSLLELFMTYQVIVNYLEK